MELAVVGPHGQVLADREAALAAWKAGAYFQIVGLAAKTFASTRNATKLREAGIRRLNVYQRRTSAVPIAVIELD